MTWRTDSEAGEVRCPFAPSTNPYCVASSCAMWRTGSRVHETKNELTLPLNDKPKGFVHYEHADAEGWKWTSAASHFGTRWHQYRFTPAPGYCGLAGKPEDPS